MATGVDYFIENSTMLMWIWDKVRAKESEDVPCWFSWAIISAWPLLLIIGKIFCNKISYKLRKAFVLMDRTFIIGILIFVFY